MVHALQNAYMLLKPAGIVVEVHYLPIAPVIEVHSAKPIIEMGWQLDKADFEVERSEFNALFQTVENGEFS